MRGPEIKPKFPSDANTGTLEDPNKNSQSYEDLDLVLRSHIWCCIPRSCVAKTQMGGFVNGFEGWF